MAFVFKEIEEKAPVIKTKGVKRGHITNVEFKEFPSGAEKYNFTFECVDGERLYFDIFYIGKKGVIGIGQRFLNDLVILNDGVELVEEFGLEKTVTTDKIINIIMDIEQDEYNGEVKERYRALCVLDDKLVSHRDKQPYDNLYYWGEKVGVDVEAEIEKLEGYAIPSTVEVADAETGDFPF